MTSVSTSTFYERASTDIAALRSRAEELQASMGRGQRLSRSSDDPVAAARMRNLTRKDSFAAIDATSAARASSELQLTDSTLGSFADHVIRLRELATQAANGTLTPAQRAGIGAEVEQLHGELIRLANSRDSTGHALFGGETSGQAYVLDLAGNPVYAGTASAGELPLGDGQTITRGLTGPEFLNFSVNGTPTDLFAVTAALSAALGSSAGDPAQAARDAFAGLDAGLEAINTAQTVVGTRMNWIDLNLDRQTRLSEMRASEEAEVGGIDIATAITQLQEILTVLEASQASFARLASLSLFDVIR
jgi:flagellar hook-associated protein 3 FlgL